MADVQQRRIGVIAERQAVDNPWIDHRWRVTAILDTAPAVPAWTCLERNASVQRFYAGPADLMLFPRETDTLKYNIEGDAPAVYVFLRTAPGVPGMEVAGATVCVGEAHAHADTGSDLVEPVPMPPAILELGRRLRRRASHRARGLETPARGRDRAPPATQPERSLSGFLARWSRRKAASRAAPGEPSDTNDAPPPDLPPLESLGAESDYTVFLRAACPTSCRPRRSGSRGRATRSSPTSAAWRNTPGTSTRPDMANSHRATTPWNG